MLKIVSVMTMCYEQIETEDDDIFGIYERYSADNWRKWYGESTESEYDYAELEAAYQEYIKLKEDK